MESPHHGAPDPGSHPRLATEGPEAGSRRNATQSRCRRRHAHARVPLRQTPQGRGNRGSTEIKTLPATLVSVCLWGCGSFHYCRAIHSNPAKALSANDMTSLRTRGLCLGGAVNEKASGRLPEELLCYWRCGTRLWPRETRWRRKGEVKSFLWVGTQKAGKTL